LERRVTISKGALDSILEFNNYLVIVFKGLESIDPVIDCEIALLVRVKLGEQFLGQWQSHVKPI
jgi:hypothetical protein